MDAKEYFKQHPAKTEVFQTSDSTLFHLECNAKNHAKTLADKNVKRVANSNAKPDKPATTTVASNDVIGSEEAESEKAEGKKVEEASDKAEVGNVEGEKTEEASDEAQDAPATPEVLKSTIPPKSAKKK